MFAALLMIGGGVGAGIFGSLLGLGGGVLIVPLLTLGFGLPLREAVGVSLVSVIVTSSASASVYLQRHVANLRLGMTLELFTALGAVIGGLVAFSLSDQVLAALFAVLLVYVALTMLRRREAPAPAAAAPATPPGVPTAGASEELAAAIPETSARIDRLSGQGYRIRNLRTGIIGSIGAGVISAILGVGGGIIKVPLMNLAMGVPLRIATATSNLMIGVTASASAIVYLLRGGIDPWVAGPTAVGVFLGASIGSRIAHRVDVRVLRTLFVVVLLYTAVQMVLRAVGPA
jgi:uncharacterized membrane protein YfcA